ncbi:MAG TPA: hypothetical protein VHE53_03780 [Patescibacteria group bacterium]|nr:hypothetical protein [Patescibacteria group bacterium]
MNILKIDTRNNSNIKVTLLKGEEKFERESEAVTAKAQVALPLISELLKESDLKIQDIDEIEVEKTDGSLTGLRVGVAIANALSFGAQIKINGKELGEIELPEY